MVKLSRISFAVSALLLLMTAASVAQDQRGGQFSQMREKYKYTFQLMGMARHINEINKDPKYALSPDQAKRVLAVLQPLRSKPRLTQDESKQALKDLKKVFTLNQLNAMARIKPRPRTGQRPPTGEGRPGGDRPMRPHRDPNAMKDFNPFYAKADPKDESAVRSAKRWNEFFTGLQGKAKTAKDKSGKASVSPAKKVDSPK